MNVSLGKIQGKGLFSREKKIQSLDFLEVSWEGKHEKLR